MFRIIRSYTRPPIEERIERKRMFSQNPSIWSDYNTLNSSMNSPMKSISEGKKLFRLHKNSECQSHYQVEDIMGGHKRKGYT